MACFCVFIDCTGGQLQFMKLGRTAKYGVTTPVPSLDMGSVPGTDAARTKTKATLKGLSSLVTKAMHACRPTESRDLSRMHPLSLSLSHTKHTQSIHKAQKHKHKHIKRARNHTKHTRTQIIHKKSTPKAHIRTYKAYTHYEDY